MVVGSLVGAYYIGTTVNQRQQNTNNNLCLTDRAIVSTLIDGLHQWTAKLVKQFGRPTYENARRRTFSYAIHFQQVAPCEIQFRLPPDITKGG